MKKLFKAYAERVRSVPNIDKQAKYNLFCAILSIFAMCLVHFLTPNTFIRCVAIVILCICMTDCICSYAIQKEHIKNENKKKAK